MSFIFIFQSLLYSSLQLREQERINLLYFYYEDYRITCRISGRERNDARDSKQPLKTETLALTF